MCVCVHARVFGLDDDDCESNFSDAASETERLVPLSFQNGERTKT